LTICSGFGIEVPEMKAIVKIKSVFIRLDLTRGFATQKFLVHPEKYTENSVDFRKIPSYKIVNV